MEGDCLSCIKYLMFVFNFFIFLGGSVLLAVGVWVSADPLGFREAVAVSPLLVTGVSVVLVLGGLLFLLGFLGCCGASGPDDFQQSLFRLLHPNQLLPEACCQGNGNLGVGGVEQCVSGGVAFQHSKGCYSALVEYFETYIYAAGALTIGVITIEVTQSFMFPSNIWTQTAAENISHFISKIDR
ncbi:tetraspanin-18-like [Poecilia formosa]|uniref:tetraspanin-18-like n=1 Tax=Poecilia formosa TaxID=48698 RepID=UPI0007B8A8B0|nr:PREDICTED: tetraspanin-18-like [Poecilia formosa]